ncbi:hypothetical protein F5887DRAFT_924994 [Amanita rubescens]|nr:hypothetical protein F5887DRAFT_924994 [Amanita rubescens]
MNVGGEGSIGEEGWNVGVTNKGGVVSGDRARWSSEVSVVVGMMWMLSGCGGGACRENVGEEGRNSPDRGHPSNPINSTDPKGGDEVGKISGASRVIKGLMLTWRGFLCGDIADGDETCVEGPIEHET